MSERKTLPVVFLALVLTVLLCASLYTWDNKYTHKSIQPVSGILFVPPDMELCWLIREWMVYPDVLLTPDTVGTYDGYRIYGDIGGTMPADCSRMTYRLTLVLPDTPRTYAVELPEVFSACIMYVNDHTVLELGSVNDSAYREEIGSRIVTFSASGVTELLIACADRSGIQRGLTYPPSFGSPERVLEIREWRMLLHSCFVLLALIGAGFSLLFTIRSKIRYGLVSVLLCVSAALVAFFPLLHSIRITGIQPWYTLEPMCYYSLLLLSLLLYGHICGIRRTPALLTAQPCVLGILLTLIRFSAASVLPSETAMLFSAVSTILKFYTAGCLGVFSVIAFRRMDKRSIWLLCGAVSYTVLLLFDRFFPLYEPIYGGWPGEIGGILITVILSAVLCMDAAEAYRFRAQYEIQYSHMQKRLLMQKEHYEQLTKQIALAREADHDLRHHMRLLSTYAAEKNWDKLKDYLTRYEPHVREWEIRQYSDHPVADAVLGYYAVLAKKQNVDYDVRFTASADLVFPDDELCILLSNLLENALDALAAQSFGSRRLFLRGSADDKNLKLAVDNTFSGSILKKYDRFLSTKHPGPGMGIQSVKHLVDRYHGLVVFEPHEHTFHVSVQIPLKCR